MTDLSIETTKNILFGNPRWSDVEIHVWDADRKMHVQCHSHRAILATFSGIMRAALLAKSDVIARPVLAIQEEWCTPALFDVVLRWMYTQSIYSNKVPALDKTKRDTYHAQWELLLSIRKIAENCEIAGLVDACKLASEALAPYL
ncbi:hypothetical protein DE146DRAFT_761216 [Phaeosphaeria sp. MPI-PUGE-AT-0046c]|nr:hypothetical protein DE146DRAFT_761216 [Phaeosphaeria sp. MPI-PUGE-AT-0046c]